MTQFFNFQKRKGFTIIELVISIFVLSVGVVGVFTAFSIILILTSDATNRLTATYLTQEGIEVVRNIRDTNWLNMDTCASGGFPANGASCPATWIDALEGCDMGCEVDYTTTGTGSNLVGPIFGNYLNIEDASDFYGYGTGSPTKFKRKVKIISLEDYVLKVTVEVSWDKKATILGDAVSAGSADPIDSTKCNPSNCVSAEETLYNWYNYIP